MEGMKQYPAYKPESRVPGVTEVPEHWEVIRNSVIFREVSETGYGDLELLSILSDRGVVKQSETGRKERAPEDRSQYKRILNGDIGYNLMNAFVGAIGVSNYDGIISPAYAVCRPKIEIDATYFHYLFRTDLYLTEFDRNAYGIMDERNRLYFDNFKNIYVPFPPIDEQRRIITYINHKLAQIDQFICYKRRLIELLNEQKTVLINRAVTKGLNSAAPMKPSGIEWLGEIPEYWSMKRLKFLTNFVTSGSRGWAKYYSDNGSTFLRIGNLSNTSIELDLTNLQFVNPPQGAEGERTRVCYEDLLISITALIGAVGVVPQNIGETYVNQHIALVRLIKKEIYPRWVAYCTRSIVGQNQFFTFMNGGTKDGLTLDDVKNLFVLVPPLSEQIEIANYIDSELTKVDSGISQVQREIELIQEYRTTLISYAVTGKIDVRDTLERGAALVAGGV